tara:strand:+ start:396 stop:566 length:171 start_codon:yes stop_codon:yes gene_type:complete
MVLLDIFAISEANALISASRKLIVSAFKELTIRANNEKQGKRELKRKKLNIITSLN